MAKAERTTRTKATVPTDLPFPTVAIIGSGFGGLCMGIQLDKAGFSNFTIFEKANRVGGTWRDNSYPGAACDVPSHLYSFSFEPKPDWSRGFPPQAEILDYIDQVADKYNLRDRIQFNTSVEGAEFDEQAGLWHIRTKEGGDHYAHVLVSGCGQLNRPAFPKIKGMDQFQGTSFHSARWNHEHKLKGRNVAVIGTGASAIQFVAPVAEQAGKLFVFQRSPAWIMEKPDYPYTKATMDMFRRFPAVREAYRNFIYWSLETRFSALKKDSYLGDYVKNQCRRYLEEKVKSPELRKALTPDYELGCKRILISNDYYEALQRHNVELVTSPIEKILPGAVVTKDGVRHDVDTIIYGTGFQSTDFLAPMKIKGLGGRDLHETWKDGAEAYHGITVSGFPNLFMLYGPNTNLGHNSIIFMIECEVRYSIQCIEQMVDKRLKYLHPKVDRQRQYNEWVQRELKDRVWASGCSSWYVNEAGKNTNNWPTYTVEFWRQTRKVDFTGYETAARG